MTEIASKWRGVGVEAVRQIVDTAITVGKSALHCVMPDDIELYLCALELVNCENTRVGYLSFSVMPEQISESFTPIQTMIKTHSGVVTTFNSSFSPIDIQIAGTFGRKFRLLLNYTDPYVQRKGFMSQIVSGGSFLSLNFGSVAGVSAGVKSGYGMTKILEHIMKSATSIDYNGKPYYLKFFNYSLNTAYIVDVVNFSTSQSLANNCMWNYSMNLRAVCPIYSIGIKNKLKDLLPQVASNSIANGVTNIVNSMTRMI